jgi:gas vesicle protein
MKETIVGALIIGGLIGGAILLTSPNSHNSIHQITGTKDMVWVSDGLHINDQEGNKHVVIKKIRKSHDQDVEVDVKATLEKLKEEMDSVDWDEVAEAVPDSFEELDINIDIEVDSDDITDSIGEITKAITEAVSEAVKGISGKIKVAIKVNNEVTEVTSESGE